ncbi:Acyl-CoA synthetase (AMP-forming)/AMP-acid ligase II [Actinacidiphila yanglinensis]|uniref:Acyl-CoA synthetase (AMP-forming)/AMP-acid ligase II n=1 Tax=Actinacidiphila yanglinensis TaxID=310779 RepID=A0A1H6E785_9ACTN|nr:AMP-binding protein [Actinacidiphila yanglinensis]SEG93572.1 Acyl-CoA synthetase (AMP-forming)/AMP-acid ligase II [Actinacidiphila yanglinensis]
MVNPAPTATPGPRPESYAAGVPLDTLGDLIGGPRIDDLLHRAAAAAPDRVAVRDGASTTTYRELEALADRYAAGLAELTGGPGGAVAIATALDRWFPPAFFGIARCGGVPALFNPLLRENGLAHVLSACSARVAVIPPGLYERLASIRGRLPELRHVVLTHRDPSVAGVPSDVPTLDELGERAAGAPPAAPGDGAADPPGDVPDQVACIQFTSGTTGSAKTVLLSHRNLLVNAAQSARAHGLDSSSVVFDYLPTFHLMHLTITVAVGGTLVLCTQQDPADAMDTANRLRATHFYSLPVRLARLAVHPRLPELECPSLRAVLSGGSTLPPAAATALHQHFGAPAVQGYGLQETSPSTHFDSLTAPRSRSSGPPVAGTECRIVHVDTGAVQPVGDKGGIQVRGPQLMKGYLGRDLALDTDADGWFSTGDIGVMDEDGFLFVVDRVKDVFKRDNWLVSPTEIERVLLRHPAVADCAVVDHPHEFSGAVARGFVVLADHAPAGAEAVVAEVNAELPYYEHIELVEVTDRIPRSPTGKILRQELRARPVAAEQPTPRQEMRSAMHYFVNRFTVTGDAEEFERLLGKITDYMAGQPGFRSYKLYRSVQDRNVYVETAEWDDAAAHQKAVSGDGFRGPVMEIMKLAKAEAGPYTLVTEHNGRP